MAVEQRAGPVFKTGREEVAKKENNRREKKRKEQKGARNEEVASGWSL